MVRKGEPGGDAITELARRLARQHPDAPVKTLARRLVADANGAITLKQAYHRMARQFGVAGKRMRRQMKPTVVRAKRQSGVDYMMPPSRSESWEPYELWVTGTVGVLSDIHVPYHDEVALGAAVAHLEARKIDALVLNGDTADFYAISRFDKDPRKRDFRGELAAVRSMIGWLRSRFENIPIVFKVGNHEHRWRLWLAAHFPEICDEPEMGLENWLHLTKHDVALVDDQRPIMAGKLPILHGHEEGKGISAPVNPARGSFLRLKHTVLKGHCHQTSSHCEPDMFGREIFCWSTGCLCDLRPEYARFNRFNHGAALVTVEKDGQFNVENFRIAGGKVRSS